MANNYTLGRGEMHLGQFKPGTQTPRGERYLGNTPELGYTAEQESLDHYSSDYGIRQKDQSVTLQLDYSGSFVTDNISPANLAMMFLGEAAVKTVTGGAFDAADITYIAVTAGATCEAVVIYKDTGVPGTSALIAYIDTITGFPLATNGGDITIQWDNGTYKIFAL